MKAKNTILTTEYSKDMDGALPWQDYPRPLLKRDSYLCLNGPWDFTFDFGGAGVLRVLQKSV